MLARIMTVLYETTNGIVLVHLSRCLLINECHLKNVKWLSFLSLSAISHGLIVVIHNILWKDVSKVNRDIYHKETSLM